MRAVGLSNRWIGRATLLGLTTWGLACGETSTQPTIDSIVIQAARGGGGSGPKVKVNSTDPTGAPQDTRLDVTVFGSGFDMTSQVEFLLNRKSTNDIKTNSTKLVDENEVLADITIAADAVVDLFDVKVTAAGGRKRGIGIELFEVSRNPGATGRAEAEVEITGGVATVPAIQPVNFTENSNRLRFNTGAFDILNIDLAIAMTLTESAKIGACEPGGNTDEPGLDDLFAKLIDNTSGRKLFVRIDKNSLDPPSPSLDNEFLVNWTEGDKGPFDLIIRSAKLNPGAGSPTVTLAAGDINGDEFTVKFTGGSVVLKNRTGKVRDHLALACPNLDVITITLERL